MKIGDAPCMGCEERYFGCHSKCSKYQEFRAKRDKENEARVKAAEARYYFKPFSKTKRQDVERKGR